MPALIIFIQNPEKGIFKSPLQSLIGEDAALQVYQQQLANIRSLTAQFPGERLLFYSDYLNWNDDWDITVYRKRIQQGETFSEKISRAFEEVLADGNESAILLQSAGCGLSAEILTEAANLLSTRDLVVGLTRQNRICLLGLRLHRHEMLRKISWDAGNLQEQLAGLADEMNLSYEILPVLHDLDTIEDLRRSGLKYI